MPEYNWTHGTTDYRPRPKYVIGVRNFLVNGIFLSSSDKRHLLDVLLSLAPNRPAQDIIRAQYGECNNESEQLGDLYLANTIYLALHDNIWPWEETERQRKIAKLEALRHLIKRK